jgi:uncharacterized protein YjhX (UPF0386 family)
MSANITTRELVALRRLRQATQTPVSIPDHAEKPGIDADILASLQLKGLLVNNSGRPGCYTITNTGLNALRAADQAAAAVCQRQRAGH